MTLPALRKDWGSKWLELWAERAALMEFVGNLPREMAERYAEQDIRKVAAKEGS